MTISDLMTAIHHGSPASPAATSEPPVMRARPRRRGGGRRRAPPRRGRRPRRACGRCRARSSTEVPFERTETRSPLAIPRRSASPADEADLALGPLELELGHALDLVAGEERAVAQEPERSDEVAPPGASAAGDAPLERSRRRLRARRTARARAAGPARRASRARARRRSARRAPRTRPPAWGESSTSKRAASFASQASSSGTGGVTARRRRWTRPSRFIEVPSRSSDAVAGSTRSAQPVASDVEHRDREHAVGLLRQRAHARVGRGVVARDDQEPDSLALDLVLVGRGRPGLGDPARVRRGREVERGAAGLALESERVRRLGEPGAATAAGPGPDEHRPLASRAAACRARSATRRAPAARRRRRRVALGRAAGGADRDDLGAVAARLLEPEVDDGRAVDDRVVADDHDDLGLADRRERRAERVERGRGRLVEHRRVRAEAAPHEHAEPVGDLGRLRPGERGDDAARRRRAAAPPRGRARRPSSIGSSPSSPAGERLDHPVRRAAGAGT